VKKFLLFIVVMAMLGVSALSQQIDKPTLTPKPCTDAQHETVQAGVVLHDANKYDAAIEKYQQVLTANPDCTLAIYELSMTLYAKGDKTKAMETAYRGSKYKSDQLPLFYLSMANIIDDVGKPDEAVRIYKDGIKMLEGDKTMLPHLSSMHYNLGITYTGQKKFKEARDEMKRAIEYNHRYASPHYVLSKILFDSRYKIPALLAAARFISLEFNSDRSRDAAAIINSVLGSTAARTGANGNITITLDSGIPKDEGDFGAAELILSMTDAINSKLDDKKTILTPEENFADRLESLIGFLDASDKKNKETFSAKNYFAFMQEMKKRGFVKPLAYLVLTHTGNQQALKWIGENDAKMMEFVTWAKSYEPQ